MDGHSITILVLGFFLAAALFYQIYMTHKNERDARLERREYASSLIQQTRLFLEENARTTDTHNVRYDTLENKLLMFTSQNYGMQLEQAKLQLRQYEEAAFDKDHDPDDEGMEMPDEEEMPTEDALAAQSDIRKMVEGFQQMSNSAPPSQPQVILPEKYEPNLDPDEV